METEKYDAIIIGAGSAGLGCLGMAKELGWKALIIDRDEANIGGDCLNYGCVPSKALIHVAKQFYGARKAQEFGLEVSGKADLSKVMDYVHAKQAVIRAHESADYLRDQGVSLVIGKAQFVSEKIIAVGERQYEGKKIFICTGSSPRHLLIEGIDLVSHYNNESLFYKLVKLPDHLLVVGGGAIGCEMAQAFNRLGSKVTIVNRGERILGKERIEICEILQNKFREEGITVLNEIDLKKFSDATTAVIENRKTKKVETIEFDVALISIGRTLNHKSLNVDAAGIKQTERGKIVVNDYLQSSVDHIYVVGDAAGMYLFSHGAEKHVNLLKHNFSSLINKRHTIKGLSWVTFTDPEVASFGLTEEYLQEKEISYWRQDQSFEHDDRAITADYDYGQITLFVSRERNKSRRKIYGGSIIAPNAGEIMQELHLASIADICLNDFMEKVYAYPTASRINQQTIMGIVNYKE